MFSLVRPGALTHDLQTTNTSLLELILLSFQSSALIYQGRHGYRKVSINDLGMCLNPDV